MLTNEDKKKLKYKIAFDFTTLLVLIAGMVFWFDLNEYRVAYGILLIVGGGMGCVSLLLEKYNTIFQQERTGYSKILFALQPFILIMLISFGLMHVLR